MAVQEPQYTIGHVPAGADLSGLRHRVVQLDNTGRWVLSDGSDPIGVLRNEPSAAGEAASVVLSGVMPVRVGTGGVSAGDAVTVDANGDVTTAAAGDSVFGHALEAAAATEFVSVLLTRPGAA